MNILRTRFCLVPVVAALLTLSACGGEPVPENVVARSTYGDTTVSELESYILSLPAGRRQPAEGQTLADWRRTVVQEMLVTRRLTEEAIEADLLATDEGQAYVSAQRDPFLQAVVRDRRIAEKVVVSDEELRAYYDAHPDEFGHGPQIRVRHIFKRTPRHASEQEREGARQAIEALRQQIAEGASFTELARTQSDSETAPLDGLIGRLDPGALGSEIDRIVWALDEGEVSDVVSTPTGFHIFRVDNRLEPFEMEFEEARGRLRRRLEGEQTEATIAEFFDELIQASGAVYNPDGVDGEEDTLVFSLDDIELTKGRFLERILSYSFEEQRAMSLREHLERAVTQELYLWQAEQLELAEEEGLAAQLERIDEAARIELAYRARRREHLEQLDESLLEAYYQENLARFESKQLIKMRMLLRHFEGEGGQEWFELYEELDRLAQGIREGRLDLAAEAARISEDLSASNGGDVGWVQPGAIGEWGGPGVSKAVLDLVPNEVSDPILVERYDREQLVYERVGYMLARVEEIRGREVRPFEEVRDQVAEDYVANGSEELQQLIRREVLEDIDATVFPGNL